MRKLNKKLSTENDMSQNADREMLERVITVAHILISNSDALMRSQKIIATDKNMTVSKEVESDDQENIDCKQRENGKLYE
jgi:hypothetical protein